MMMRERKVGEQANRLTYVHIIYEVATIQRLNTKMNKPIDWRISRLYMEANASYVIPI